MKRIIAGLALAFSVALSQAATLVPVQLLNPAGSAANQAIVSTGASSAPAWAAIVNSVAGRSGAVTLAVADVSGAAPLASPTFTGTVTIPTGANITKPNIVGTATNDNAAAGNIGEYISSTQSTAVTLTSGSSVNITSISLTPGDWLVSGVIVWSPAGTTVMQVQQASISTTTGSAGPLGNNAAQNASTVAGNGATVATPNVRMSVSTTTTVYLVATQFFTTSTATGTGKIEAWRMR